MLKGRELSQARGKGDKKKEGFREIWNARKTWFIIAGLENDWGHKAGNVGGLNKLTMILGDNGDPDRTTEWN